MYILSATNKQQDGETHSTTLLTKHTMRLRPPPLLSELGTYKTVRTRVHSLMQFYLFARKRPLRRFCVPDGAARPFRTQYRVHPPHTYLHISLSLSLSLSIACARARALSLSRFFSLSRVSPFFDSDTTTGVDGRVGGAHHVGHLNGPGRLLVSRW